MFSLSSLDLDKQMQAKCKNDVSLQINLSPGDIDYALLTVPMLVAAHRSEVREVLAVVDCCRPQRTRIVNPDKRFPASSHSKKVDLIKEISLDLQKAGHIDRIFLLQPGDKIIKDLSRKYLAGTSMNTHDYGGCGLMSYLAGIELAKTHFVLHYDADMLLFQEANYSWIQEARLRMGAINNIIAASPRIGPPFAAVGGSSDAPSVHEGRPLEITDGGWLNDWFSTRCFLLDKNKLRAYLPIVRNSLWIEILLRKLIRRGYPISPEMMLFKGPGKMGARRLNLSSPKAWLLHPTIKPAAYLELLPDILNAVSLGMHPKDQKGKSDIILEAWEKMLKFDSFHEKG